MKKKNKEKIKKETLADKLQKVFSKNEDLMIREIAVANEKVSIFFFESMVNKEIINESIIKPLLEIKKLPSKNKVDFLIANVLQSSTSEKKQNLGEAEKAILEGSTVVIFDGESSFVKHSTQGYPKRAISEPPSSAVIKGPREGFTEDIYTNISLVRRRIRSTELVVTFEVIGRETSTNVAIVYMNNIADESVVNEVKKRLKKIDIDGLVDSYYIQEFLENNKNSIFKQVGNAEKPDIATAKLLEGRVLIIMDGSPIALTVPFLFIEDLQSSDDYYNHPVHATFVRIIRVFGLLLGALLPGIFVATQVFHYRILPINFLISLMGAAQGISLPPLVEIIFVLFLFEILNEASIRMPKYLGMALSIIGALILGEVAVSSGLISPPAILVVAISGITIYTVPEETGTASILRLLFTVVGGLSGYYGILIASIFTIGYMVSIENFGTPYFAPYAPKVKDDKKDAIVKASLHDMIKRPKSFPNKNRIRMKIDD